MLWQHLAQLGLPRKGPRHPVLGDVDALVEKSFVMER
jgi:hypothetical protein